MVMSPKKMSKNEPSTFVRTQKAVKESCQSVVPSKTKEQKKANHLQHDKFLLSGALKSLSRPINQQEEATRTLLQQAAQKCFDNLVPYVFSYTSKRPAKIVYDLEGYAEKTYRSSSQGLLGRPEDGLWKNNFSSATFFVFLDAQSPAIKLGTMTDLQSKGFTDDNLLWSLLTPTAEPKKSQALYLFLVEEKLISDKFKPYADTVQNQLSKENITWEKEDLLIDFAGSRSSNLLEKMLQQNVDPNAFSDLFGVHAINVAQANKRQQNADLLVKYGANPHAKPQDPTV